ncbi:hypothetical protein F6R98_09460 [Candidatus Methylospira mobilis]|uniref:Uncharacterized protein n=1 Tax=Candidatus Methylospira mobilis TaxID=1808979 RepID=A0A5Q0BH06_9GAMM|nr:hypothetical protein [Candidatus Methylospira mobilis]QFY42819.1 hypothetical protein F6R98_09460 [Candidatus Methylospira mobilis]WNV03711.1 hypothetical protein RP726_14850 [Candidatus Methylospira mobilis]
MSNAEMTASGAAQLTSGIDTLKHETKRTAKPRAILLNCCTAVAQQTLSSLAAAACVGVLVQSAFLNYIAEDSEARADDFINRVDQKFSALTNAPVSGIGRLRYELAADLWRFPTTWPVRLIFIFPGPTELRSSAYCIAPAI